MTNRPRCACGYLAASHEGLRWHWSQKWCDYGGEPTFVSYADLGKEAPPIEPRKPPRVRSWMISVGRRNVGPYTEVQHLLDDLCDLVREEQKSGGDFTVVFSSQVIDL